MAFKSPFSLVFPLLLFSVSCFTLARIPSEVARNDVVGYICNATIDPSLCSQILRSDPRSSGADQYHLCQLTIDIALSHATKTYGLIQSLDMGVMDQKLKLCYHLCSHDYNTCLGDLRDAKRHLVLINYENVNIYASAAKDAPVTCDGHFEGNITPVFEAPQLKQANQKLKVICDIILTITTMFG